MEWLWRERLKGEEEGVDTMQGINKVLLENLLPAHVARHFITIIKVNSQPAPAFDHLAIQINICWKLKFDTIKLDSENLIKDIFICLGGFQKVKTVNCWIPSSFYSH